MRHVIFAFPALAVGLLAAADTKDDAARLQGSWVMVSLEINGEPMSEDQVASGRLVVEGDRYTPTYEGKAYPETFTIDPGASPRAIDFTYTDGPRRGETVKGIYKIEGDRYIMCRAVLVEDKRPESFATGAESGLALVVWRRDSPAEDARRKAVEADRKALEGTWVAVSGVRDGMTIAVDDARPVVLTIVGDRYTFAHEDQTDRGSSVIDPAANPKTIDITYVDGEFKGRRRQGIYEIEGDRHKACFAPAGKDRPICFASEPGSGNVLWHFKRGKSARPTAGN